MAYVVFFVDVPGYTNKGYSNFEGLNYYDDDEILNINLPTFGIIL